MKKYYLKNRQTDKLVGIYETKIDAANSMEDTIDENNDELDEDDSNYLIPFEIRECFRC